MVCERLWRRVCRVSLQIYQNLPVVAVVRQCPRAIRFASSSELCTTYHACQRFQFQDVSSDLYRMFCKSLFRKRLHYPMSWQRRLKMRPDSSIPRYANHSTAFFLCVALLLLMQGLRWQERNGPFRRCCSTLVAKVCVGESLANPFIIHINLCYGGLLEAFWLSHRIPPVDQTADL